MELVKQLETKRTNATLLKAIFKGDNLPENLIEKENKITEYLPKRLAYVYMGDRTAVDYDTVYDLAVNLGYNAARDYQIDLSSFVLVEKLTLAEVIDAFTKGINFAAAKLYNKKTFTKKENKNNVTLFLEQPTEEAKKAFNKASILIDAQNWARNLGITAPNDLNSEQLADIVAKDFKQYKNLTVKVLERKEIEKLGMGLLLSVNRGSVYEPRVVVIEYKGNPASLEKTVYVGKGITFDSGGYNIKTGRYMLGMKYDMSGSAIVAAAMKAIAQLKPETNVSAVMCITDNRVNGDASLPDSVWTSMSGKTVEINNTDAEGRLVMADGLYYGAKNLHATRLIDVATLTGAMIMALGETYTGTWATTDKAWNDISKAAKKQHELIWRMPFDDDYERFMKGSLVADLKNTDLTGMGGSCSAAMFLKEFTDGVEYIHLDVAGTNEQDEKPMFAMVKTLTELAL
ncbi:M17 family metallopeptidase [Metamycoplasma neophronis]|uniref:Probable cytosol aminopeptidase n=1 Tax=Metamycoplasma neophronis TaxID=872983 RepID=A0ABY2Z0F7_9BACT|nr:M17 family metallopeptidase [Metamycoplasma neophronis]TPR53873.1 leucyl aminopeptidase family protein [Metamycoplasma neophronis]